jgi:hypothetical protein
MEYSAYLLEGVMQDEEPTAVTLNEKDVELECFKRGYDCEFRLID